MGRNASGRIDNFILDRIAMLPLDASSRIFQRNFAERFSRKWIEQGIISISRLHKL